MSTTDVHRLIDNKLPEGKKCTAVSMYLVYTAKIDGEDVTVSVEPGLSEEDIAIALVAEVGTTANAAMEGEDIPDEDDELQAEAFDDDETAPKTKGKTKKKK